VKLLVEDYTVSDIWATEKSIWACTSGEGLVCYDRQNKTIEKYTTQSGLPSNYVNSILLSDDYLWLVTESGLCRFNPNDKTVSTYASFTHYSSVLGNVVVPFIDICYHSRYYLVFPAILYQSFKATSFGRKGAFFHQYGARHPYFAHIDKGTR
jgi:hypothetical protein